jgi:hypothetical protein
MTLKVSETVFFVRKDSEILDSLFVGPSTASGTYEVRKNGILFRDPKGHARAFLVANEHGERFFVSCSQIISKSGRKSIRYMHSLCALDELFLGVKGFSYSEEYYLASSLWGQALNSAN